MGILLNLHRLLVKAYGALRSVFVCAIVPAACIAVVGFLISSKVLVCSALYILFAVLLILGGLVTTAALVGMSELAVLQEPDIAVSLQQSTGHGEAADIALFIIDEMSHHT